MLGPFHPKLQKYALKSLQKRNVDLRLETAVKEVREDGVLVEKGGEQEFLPAGIVVWASGVTTHPTVAGWSVPQGRGGRIETDEQRRVKGLDNVFAIGDVSIGPEQLPQLAQPAIQGGKYVAKLIKADLKGKTRKPFKYRDKGTMATIGRASAVAEIKFMPKMTGFLAWIIWVGLHIVDAAGQPQPVRHLDQPLRQVPRVGEPQRDRGRDAVCHRGRAVRRRGPSGTAHVGPAGPQDRGVHRRPRHEGIRQDRDDEDD